MDERNAGLIFDRRTPCYMIGYLINERTTCSMICQDTSIFYICCVAYGICSLRQKRCSVADVARLADITKICLPSQQIVHAFVFCMLRTYMNLRHTILTLACCIQRKYLIIFSSVHVFVVCFAKRITNYVSGYKNSTVMNRCKM